MTSLGNKMIMAENLKYYLDKKGINQTDLCNDLGFPLMTVSDWINAKTYPRIDKIEMMANYFGVNKSDLVENRSEREIDPLYEELIRNPLLKRLVAAGGKLPEANLEAFVQAMEMAATACEYTGLKK